MKNISIPILFVAFLIFGSAAQATPNQVFRVDDRDPATIFQTGFLPWGTNANLVEHLEGATCNLVERPAAAGVEGSVYISTSDNTQVAMNVVRVRLRQMVRANQPPVIWLYTIRATANVFNVATTFEAGGQPLGTGRLQPAYRTALVLREWVVRGPVFRDMIVGAQRYELVNDVPVAVANGYLANPNYVPQQTEANPAALPRTVMTNGQTTMGRLRAVITDGARLAISACWCNSRGNPGGTARATLVAAAAGATPGAGAACVSQINHVWPATPSATYVPGPGFWRVDL